MLPGPQVWAASQQLALRSLCREMQCPDWVERLGYCRRSWCAQMFSRCAADPIVGQIHRRPLRLVQLRRKTSSCSISRGENFADWQPSAISKQQQRRATNPPSSLPSVGWLTVALRLSVQWAACHSPGAPPTRWDRRRVRRAGLALGMPQGPMSQVALNSRSKWRCWPQRRWLRHRRRAPLGAGCWPLILAGKAALCCRHW